MIVGIGGAPPCSSQRAIAVGWPGKVDASKVRLSAKRPATDRESRATTNVAARLGRQPSDSKTEPATAEYTAT